jgi:hypothetical protein
MRLVREALTLEEGVARNLDTVEAVLGAEDDDKTYAAMGVAKTISTVRFLAFRTIDLNPWDPSAGRFICRLITRNFGTSPGACHPHNHLHPPKQDAGFVFCFQASARPDNHRADLFDNMYDLVDVLTFKLHDISPNMWPVFELTYELFKSDAIDFLDGMWQNLCLLPVCLNCFVEMLPALDNFVSYGTNVFKEQPRYREMMVDIYSTSMKAEQLGENDRVNGCKLAEAMMLNLREHIDDVRLSTW